MPSVTPRRRSRSVFEDQDEEPSSACEASKRQRMDEADDDSGEDEEEEQKPPVNSRRRQPQTNGASRANGHSRGSGFQPGAIVRVKVQNFVTYEHAEFFPGPNLNMVIGPNGTGKSSLVCAICLGLAFNPSNLGRATKMGEFVKHGKDGAIIEIELQCRPNERGNHVVRSYISKEDNKTKWRLNGKEVTRKTIETLTNALHIQVDNLCQFLPQDKVAEFAALTPVDLLHETLRAAAPEEMINWQEQLRKSHEIHKTIKQSLDSTTETLRGHEARQQGLQADVERLHEREAIKKRIDDLQTARLCAEYNTLRAQFREATSKKKEAEKQLKELERACGPALEAVNRKKEYLADIEIGLQGRRKALKDAETAAEHARHKVDELDDEMQVIQDKIEGEHKSFNARKEEIGKIRRMITNLESRHRNEPSKFDGPEWNRRIREKERSREEIQTNKRQIGIRIHEIKQHGRTVHSDIKAFQQEIEHLDSQEGQQLSLLRSVNPDAAKGWEWLQQNLDGFEKEVFGPPMLTCSLKNKQYSDVVQALLGRSDFDCFTAQTKNDHVKLSNQFFRTMALSVTVRTVQSELGTFAPPVPAEEAHRLGLDGFAIDYLDGPRPVLAMLCAERSMHTAGVALRDITPSQYEELYSSQKISQWATGRTLYRVSRRRDYGPDATTTMTRRFNQGRFWTDEPVDNAEKATLQRKIQENEDQKAALLRELKEQQEKMQEIESEEADLEQELTRLRKEKSDLQAAYTQWSALPEKIRVEKENEQAKKSSLSECRSRLVKLTSQADEAAIQRAKAVLQHKDLVSHIRDKHQALLDAQIRLIEATSNLKGLQERNLEMKRSLEERRQAITNYATEAQRLKREAQRAQQNIGSIAEGDVEYFQDLAAGKSPEDIDTEIDIEGNKLHLIHPVDPSVLVQFERRAREITELTKKKADETSKMEKLDADIRSLRERWEPKLDDLVSRINEAFGHNFEQIHCVGEVGVYKDEDFDKWAIEIKVKFRENESLQQLNQHRQSGGERAVSTIFYLMALQSMAQAPFRVVDEINQGMDPRNERMVHERMVEIACREHTSQYFLITPKLLTGLRYDERMRVLCIASGEHIPVDARQLDFTKVLAAQRALKASA